MYPSVTILCLAWGPGPVLLLVVLLLVVHVAVRLLPVVALALVVPALTCATSVTAAEHSKRMLCWDGTVALVGSET
eukprot:2470697-Pyramimonas_sp.AAC.1